jgi:hypothetical protein
MTEFVFLERAVAASTLSAGYFSYSSATKTAPAGTPMRGMVFAFVIAWLTLGVAAESRADDGFMKECLATGSRKLCDCMSAHVPPDKRAAAIAGMRKSNVTTAPGGNPANPSALSPEQMQGLDAVVAAQAACM